MFKDNEKVYFLDNGIISGAIIISSIAWFPGYYMLGDYPDYYLISEENIAYKEADLKEQVSEMLENLTETISDYLKDKI